MKNGVVEVLVFTCLTVAGLLGLKTRHDNDQAEKADKAAETVRAGQK